MVRIGVGQIQIYNNVVSRGLDIAGLAGLAAPDLDREIMIGLLSAADTGIREAYTNE